MSNPFFKFKQFTVFHDKCAMKVGTDGVLLGAWTEVKNATHILDIGTGTGLIALMLAQRSKALIDAIDIDNGAYQQALENVAHSPFAEHIRVLHTDLKTFEQTSSKRYELIVSNPPYFVDSLKCPNRIRNTARHTDTLSLSDLLHAAKHLLQTNGRLALILPYDQLPVLEKTGHAEDLHISQLTLVIPIEGGKPKRILCELQSTPCPNLQPTTLTLETTDHQRTTAYKELTGEYYL